MNQIRFFSGIALVILLECTAFGQGDALTQVQTFHVHGVVCAYGGGVVPGIQVTFESQKISKTVSSDARGVYETDLPLGLYTMIAQPYGTTLQESRRPLFRVISPTDLTFNVTLNPPDPFCDPVLPLPGHPQPADDGVRMCGGGDFFPVPSENGVPFQLFVRYQTRRPAGQRYDYNGEKDFPPSRIPVFLAYNLFTIRADHVVYDAKVRTIEAAGNVVVESADGSTQRSNSMRFKIENGEATPLP